MANPTVKSVFDKSTHPQFVHTLFETFVNTGNLEGLMSLYDPIAVLVEKNGALQLGAQRIHEFLKGLLSVKPVMRIHHRHTIEAGDVAVLISDWVMAGTLPNCQTVKDSGRTYDVIRRSGDGIWRIAIDNPWALNVHFLPANPIREKGH